MNHFDQARGIVPRNLLDEIERGNCIPFVGAGVTAEADVGIPSGGELAKLLAHECVARSNGLVEFDTIAHESLERIADKFVSIIENEPSRGGKGRVELESYLERHIPARGLRQPTLGSSSFPFLVNIPWQRNSGSIIITTNWDELIEDAVERYAKKEYDQITRDEDIAKLHSHQQRFKIIKLHGTIRTPRELLITETQFNQQLTSFSASPLFGYLAQSFATKTIVFAGYGLRDQIFRIVHTLVTRIVNEPNYKRLQPHFAVMGENPDRFDVQFWRNLGIEILAIGARDFFRYVYSETNQFINRDEQRNLDRLRNEPLCAFVGPAGVGKSYLFRRIDNDLNAQNGRSVHAYDTHLLYKFPAKEVQSPEARCLDFLDKLALKIGLLLDKQNPGEKESEYVLRLARLLRSKVTRPCLLLIDCSGKLNDLILEMLDVLFENARVGAGFNGIVASRAPLEWMGGARRVFAQNTEWLCPFTRAYIGLCLRYQALLEADFHLERQHLDPCAVEIYRITRGHPHAIKIVLERLSDQPTRLRSAGSILDFLNTQSKALNEEIVKRVVLGEMLSEVKSRPLVEILEGLLCLFRKTNASIIRELIQGNFWQPQWSSVFQVGLSVLNELLTYYIAKLPATGPMYVIDSVIRRLLLQQMENLNGTKAFQLHQYASEMYIRLAKGASDEWQRTYIIECLFHKLHFGRHSSDPSSVRLDALCSFLLDSVNTLTSSSKTADESDLRAQLKRDLRADLEFMDDFIDIFDPEKYNTFIDLIK